MVVGTNYIGGSIFTVPGTVDPPSVHVLVLSLVDCGFDINQIHTIKSYIDCFSSNHAALRSKTKDWLSWDQDNVYLFTNCLNNISFRYFLYGLIFETPNHQPDAISNKPPWLGIKHAALTGEQTTKYLV
jgi:hypothetical protein